MDSKTWWPKLPYAHEPKPPPPENSLSQEDQETRQMIARYLHLADRLLLAESTQEQEEKDKSSAA